MAAAGIVLRQAEAGDAPWITAACSDRELSRYVPSIPYPYSESDARTFIDRAAEDWAQGRAALFVIAQATSGESLGAVALHPSPRDSEVAEVGYWLRREARGRGAATIAVRLVAGWAFGHLGIKRLGLQTHPENSASQRVAHRAGFTREGLLRAWMATPNGRRDSVMFSLLPEDDGGGIRP
nr:GNAT family N-acetyltransferase [Actinopolymorpha cephalotaxi]